MVNRMVFFLRWKWGFREQEWDDLVHFLVCGIYMRRLRVNLLKL